MKIVSDDKIADTSAYYTSNFIAVIKKAQKSFGIKEDGVITAVLIKELNISIQDRIKKLLINLERMRWVPPLPQENFIIVNIPEFRLHVFLMRKSCYYKCCCRQSSTQHCYFYR